MGVLLHSAVSLIGRENDLITHVLVSPPFDTLPGSFLTLRDTLSQRLNQVAERQIPIRIDHLRGVLEIAGLPHTVRTRALAILHFILDYNQSGKIPPDQATAAGFFSAWFNEHRENLGHIDSPRFDASDFRRELNYLRDILKDAPWQPARRTILQAPFQLIN